MTSTTRLRLQLVVEATAGGKTTLCKWLGGGTIADVTSSGIGRDPAVLARISTLTSLSIVLDAGC